MQTDAMKLMDVAIAHFSQDEIVELARETLRRKLQDSIRSQMQNSNVGEDKIVQACAEKLQRTMSNDGALKFHEVCHEAGIDCRKPTQTYIMPLNTVTEIRSYVRMMNGRKEMRQKHDY